MKLLKRPLFRTPAPKPKPQVRKLNASVSRTASRAELEDYAEYDEEDSHEPNMRLTHAFIVVLILHVIAVGGVFGFNAMKSRQAAAAKAAASAPAIAEKTAPVEPVEVAPAPVAAAAPVAQAPAPVVAAPIPKEVKDIIPAPTSPSVKTATATIPAAVTAAGTTHQVSPGDTLSKIATRYHTSIEALEKVNSLPAGSVLRVGQVLQLPAVATKTATAPVAAVPVATKTAAPASAVVPAPVIAKAAPATAVPVAATPDATKDSGDIYTIAKGDNPYSVAKRLKVSYNDLMKINGITDPTKLQIGQKLKIPAKQ